MKIFKLIIEKNDDGFWGRLDKPQGIYSFGETIGQLQVNIIEAIDLYYGDVNKKVPDYEIEMVMDIQEFFKVNDFINVTTLANKIGINSSLLRQYAKGIKFPSLKQVHKIENKIRELGHQLSKTELQPH